MNAQKTVLSSSIALALGITSFTTQANLSTSATLDFTMGTPETVGCILNTAPPCNNTLFNVTDIVGSYFAIDDNGDGSFDVSEKTAIGSFNGIHIGTVQDASGSHEGNINGTESPNIDNPWEFPAGRDTGMHQTTSPITVLVDNGYTKTLDFSGWSWDWNGVSTVPFNDLGTTITCDTVSCSDSSNYTIDGAFQIAGGGFTTVSYVLHLEGTVSSVPVPAAAWLFGSGLAGLVGLARRKRV